MLLFALAIRLTAYALWGGIIHADEIFQYGEQAHRLVFGQGIVPWEYRAGIRSWLFPGILAGVMEAARLIGDRPVVQNGAIALFMAALSLPGVACARWWGRAVAGDAAGLAAGFLCAIWPYSVLMSVHPLLDTVAGDLLLPGLFLLTRAARRGTAASAAGGGLTLGLMLALRPQLAPLLLWAGLRCFWRRPRLAWPAMCGAALPLLLGGMLDWITLGSPFQSSIGYVRLNAAGAGDYFGVSPWFYYLLSLPWSTGALFPLLAVCVGVGAWRMGLALEGAALILIEFSAVPHKELRFIYPAIPLMVMLAGVGSARLARLLAPRGSRVAGPVLAGAWSVVLLANLPVAGTTSLWLRGRAMLTEMHRVSADPRSCALAIVPPSNWDVTGGYVNLRPDIALVGLSPPVQPGLVTGFDYAIAPRRIDLARTGMTKIMCAPALDSEKHIAAFCLWHNPGGCMGPRPAGLRAPDPGFLKGK